MGPPVVRSSPERLAVLPDTELATPLSMIGTSALELEKMVSWVDELPAALLAVIVKLKVLVLLEVLHQLHQYLLYS